MTKKKAELFARALRELLKRYEITDAQVSIEEWQ